MSKKIPGYILYRGPSAIDGAPIVAIATMASKNPKTGKDKNGRPMIQTWILREDVAPGDAVKTGKDRSICGDCRHRGRYDIEAGRWVDRTCYVRVHNAPRSIWDAYKRGNYTDLTKMGDQALELGIVGRDRQVRLGAYGDPYAVPYKVWANLIRRSNGHTGYTHQWRDIPTGIDSDAWQMLLMASADDAADAADATARGWRYFRVADDATRQPNEVLCPASAEAGKKSVCAKCLLCMGTRSKSRKSVTIPVHGNGAATFRRAATN